MRKKKKIIDNSIHPEKPSCEFCYELEHACICEFYKCYVCKKLISTFDTETGLYEYRGVYFCNEHMDEAIAKRDWERKEVIVENSLYPKSVAEGEYRNSGFDRKKLNPLTGEPISKNIKESYRTKQYEKRQVPLSRDDFKRGK